MSSQSLAIDPNSKGITYEENLLYKSLTQHSKEELFLKKFVDLYTKLEKQLQKQIDVIDEQFNNHLKMSESFGKLS